MNLDVSEFFPAFRRYESIETRRCMSVLGSEADARLPAPRPLATFSRNFKEPAQCEAAQERYGSECAQTRRLVPMLCGLLFDETHTGNLA